MGKTIKNRPYKLFEITPFKTPDKYTGFNVRFRMAELLILTALIPIIVIPLIAISAYKGIWAGLGSWLIMSTILNIAIISRLKRVIMENDWEAPLKTQEKQRQGAPAWYMLTDNPEQLIITLRDPLKTGRTILNAVATCKDVPNGVHYDVAEVKKLPHDDKAALEIVLVPSAEMHLMRGWHKRIYERAKHFDTPINFMLITSDSKFMSFGETRQKN